MSDAASTSTEEVSAVASSSGSNAAFESFYQSLVANDSKEQSDREGETMIRIFERNISSVYYTAHGASAEFVAKHFFNTREVLKRTDSLPCKCQFIVDCLSVSLCVSLCLSVSLCVSLCLSVSLCVSLCLSVSLCISLYLHLPPSVSLSSPSPLPLSPSLSPLPLLSLSPLPSPLPSPPLSPLPLLSPLFRRQYST
jgi:hypothetical protein